MPYHLATPLCPQETKKKRKKDRSRSSGPSALHVGWVKGFEPSTPGTTIRCSNQLSYTHHIWLERCYSEIRLRCVCRFKKVARLKGLEPLTHCLEGSCSIHLSYKRKLQHPLLERVMGIEPTRPAWKAGILPLNYTRRCNGHYYSQTGANCQGILKNFFLFQCPFPKCVFILYHILHQDAREISQKSFVFSLRFSH